MAFQGEVQGGIEQWVARTDKGRERLAGRGDQGLVEGDALIPGLHRIARTDLAVAIAHRGGHMGHLIAAGFALANAAAQLLEGFQEKRFDIVRLQTARFGAFHVFPYARHAAGVHHVMGQRPVFDQAFQVGAVDAAVDGDVEAITNLRLVAVTDGLEQQFPEGAGSAVVDKLEFAQHVEHLPTQRLTRLFEFLQQAAVDVAFAGFLGYQVPQMADFGLTDAVDTAKALFQTIRIPGQVIVDHQVGTLQVDAFAGGIRGEQDLDFGIVQEAGLGLAPFFPAHAAVDHGDRLRPAEQGADLALQVIERVAVFGEEHQLLAGRGRVLGYRPRAEGRGGFADPIRERGWGKYLAEQMREFAPLGVLAAAPDFTGQGFQLLQRGDFGLQFGQRGRRRGLVEYPLLGGFDFILGRLIQVLDILGIQQRAGLQRSADSRPALQKFQFAPAFLQSVTAAT